MSGTEKRRHAVEENPYIRACLDELSSCEMLAGNKYLTGFVHSLVSGAHHRCGMMTHGETRSYCLHAPEEFLHEHEDQSSWCDSPAGNTCQDQSIKIAGTCASNESVEAYEQCPFQRGRPLFLRMSDVDGYRVDGEVIHKAVDDHSCLKPFWPNMLLDCTSGNSSDAQMQCERQKQKEGKKIQTVKDSSSVTVAGALGALPQSAPCQTLRQIQILQALRKNFVINCLAMLVEIAERNDDHKKLDCESPINSSEGAEVLPYHTSRRCVLRRSRAWADDDYIFDPGGVGHIIPVQARWYTLPSPRVCE